NLFAFDSTTILVNHIAARYCRSRYHSLHSPTSLNGRYQAKEAYDVAKSMQPAFMSIYFAKTLLAIILLSFCYKMDAVLQCVPFLFPATFADLEVLYFLTHTILSIFLIVWLMIKHPRFRRRINSMLGESLKLNEISSASQIRDRRSEGNLYFESLTASWSLAHANSKRKR
ncbi:hypothetical protein PENTCL1PPCAC_16681, partial [Pristionchus entomophagus]